MTNTTPGAELSDTAIAQAFREGAPGNLDVDGWMAHVLSRAREIEAARELPAATFSPEWCERMARIEMECGGVVGRAGGHLTSELPAASLGEVLPPWPPLPHPWSGSPVTVEWKEDGTTSTRKVYTDEDMRNYGLACVAMAQAAAPTPSTTGSGECDRCDGTGTMASDNHDEAECSECGGSGTVYTDTNFKDCPHCTPPAKPEAEEVVTAWANGVKFAVREMAKHPVAFCTDKMVEITAKLIVDAAVKEKERMLAAKAEGDGGESVAFGPEVEGRGQLHVFNCDTELPSPDAVVYPDTGFRTDDDALMLWAIRMYDTGGTPYWGADALHSYAHRVRTTHATQP